MPHSSSEAYIATYRRIADDVINAILKGEYNAGEYLPSLNEVCDMYNVSRITALNAYKELIAKGIIVSRHGIGFMVVPDVMAVLADDFRSSILSSMSEAIKVSRWLGINMDDATKMFKELWSESTSA